MNMKVLCLAMSVFYSQVWACDHHVEFCDNSALDLLFPVRKKIRDTYNFMVPTTTDDMEYLHNIYVEHKRESYIAIDIWSSVLGLVYKNAINSVLMRDKALIIKNAKQFGMFINLTKTMHYDDGFFNRLYPQSQTCLGSISHPARQIVAAIACAPWANRLNLTCDEIKINGGYLTARLYDSILKNYGLYNGVLSAYENYLSNPQQEFDINSILKIFWKD